MIMSAMEPLYRLMRISICNLSKDEIFILEAELLKFICDEIKEFFRNHYRDYFRLMKFSKEKENIMLDINLIRLIMKDIIFSEEYNIEGIARYTDIHEDIIQEVFSGQNTDPSAKLLRRMIELHYSVRRDLYHAIMKKIALQYLEVA